MEMLPVSVVVVHLGCMGGIGSVQTWLVPSLPPISTCAVPEAAGRALACSLPLITMVAWAKLAGAPELGSSTSTRRPSASEQVRRVLPASSVDIVQSPPRLDGAIPS